MTSSPKLADQYKRDFPGIGSGPRTSGSGQTSNGRNLVIAGAVQPPGTTVQDSPKETQL